MDNSKAAMLPLERFAREASEGVRRLKNHCRRIHQFNSLGDYHAAEREKNMARQLADKLLAGLAQVMRVRGCLSEELKAQFDARIEQLHIQTAIDALNVLLISRSPSSEVTTEGVGSGLRSDNPFDSCFGDMAESSNAQQASIYEEQLVTQVRYDAKTEDMRLRMEQARADSEATEQIAKDIEELNQVMVDLSQLIHSQHDMVESIEEHVERSTHDVTSGQQNLRRAVTSKNAKYPLVAAAVGSVAIGGPVGLVASSAVAGVAAAVGGAFIGLFGGRVLKNQVQKEATRTEN